MLREKAIINCGVWGIRVTWGSDGTVPTSIPTSSSTMYAPSSIGDVAVLNLKGFDDSNFLNLRFEDADHSEKSWNKRLDTPLKFLLDTRYE